MKNFFNKRDSGKWKGDDRGGYKKKNNFGGGGGGGSWGRGGDRDERPSMHSAICDKCNKECEVPFKPTGSKPIYCRDCFRNEDGGTSRPRFAEKRFDRSDRSERPAYRSTPHSDNSGAEKQLKTLNIKMDKLISLMSELVGREEEGDFEEDEEDEVEEVKEVESEEKE
ncbi:MAG: hypothetical protein ACD_76C00109G0008 [uncultured bacterium]|nr:MAG: hypothetical protein ACD_76C00109G0008 [uncultured bacterium]HBD04932.1 hypothetical protein [Candidatus Uhrbacteria bacterium]